MRWQAVAAIATAVVLGIGVGAAQGRIAAAAPYTLHGPTAEASAWTTPAPGWDWGGGAGGVMVTYHGNGAPETARFSWKLPSSIGEEGSKGSITVTAVAGGESWAPGLQINGVLVGCSGIQNTPSYGTGCAEGDHAAVATSLQPGKSAKVTQEFLIKPGLGKVTVVIPGFSQQFVYTAVRNGTPAKQGGGGGSPSAHVSYRYSAEAGMTHDLPVIKFFGTGGFSLNHVPSGSNSTAGTAPTGTARVVIFPRGPKTVTLDLVPVSVRYSSPNKHQTIAITYKIVKSPPGLKDCTVGKHVLVKLVNYGEVDKLTYQSFCGQTPSRQYEYDVDVSLSVK